MAYYLETVFNVQACRLAQSHQYNDIMRDHNNPFPQVNLLIGSTKAKTSFLNHEILF